MIVDPSCETPHCHQCMFLPRQFYNLKILPILWSYAPRFDMATLQFVKSDMVTCAFIKIDMGHGHVSDMGHGHFLNSTCDMGPSDMNFFFIEECIRMHHFKSRHSKCTWRVPPTPLVLCCFTERQQMHSRIYSRMDLQ